VTSLVGIGVGIVLAMGIRALAAFGLASLPRRGRLRTMSSACWSAPGPSPRRWSAHRGRSAAGGNVRRDQAAFAEAWRRSESPGLACCFSAAVCRVRQRYCRRRPRCIDHSSGVAAGPTRGPRTARAPGALWSVAWLRATRATAATASTASALMIGVALVCDRGVPGLGKAGVASIFRDSFTTDFESDRRLYRSAPPGRRR
jgi:hypothetical protein